MTNNFPASTAPPRHALSCAALVLNHNGRHLLAPLFDSLAGQALTQICLIDNASTDDSVPFTEEAYPHVAIIRNTENLDFGTAYNRAIHRRQEDVVLILNSDVIVQPGAVRNALDFLAQHPDVASVSFEGVDRTQALPFPCGCAALTRFGKEFSPARQFDSADDPPSESPDYVWGAACCVRRAVFEDVRFDEAMDWGFEDVDLGWRIRLKTGLRNVFLPTATIFHLESYTAKTRFRRREIERMVTRNAILSFASNATFWELVRAAPYILYNFPFCARRWALAREVGRRLLWRALP